MAMKTNKRRRKEFRQALADAQMIRPDRFSEMMNAIAGGGSQACEGCGLQTWASDLDEHTVCAACRRAFGRLRARVPHVDAVVSHAEPNVVWADASYNNGFAGLAVCGALGEHTRTVDARSSTQAEVMALKWAMEIAREGEFRGLTFRTDCQAAFNVLRQTPARMYWTVEQVPRRENRRADYLAGKVRAEAL